MRDEQKDSTEQPEDPEGDEQGSRGPRDVRFWDGRRVNVWRSPVLPLSRYERLMEDDS